MKLKLSADVPARAQPGQRPCLGLRCGKAVAGCRPDVGDKIDHYSIVRPLGTGGQASVYEAEHDITRGRVALKVLTSCDWPDAATRFAREAELLTRISRRNLVEVKYAGISPEGYAYLAMELLKGQTLRKRLGDRLHLSVDDALRIALQMADGLMAAHVEGVFHRDVKPDNTFLLHDGTVKVLDLGTAGLMGD